MNFLSSFSRRELSIAPQGVPSIAVVIPCYRVVDQIDGVLATIGPEVDAIYCVDDACPEGTGNHVEGMSIDPRVKVLRHTQNQGVGGAMLTGYRAALADGHDVLVKIDGDGQMDPGLIENFIVPILRGEADYTKGNRFFYLENTRGMPLMRLVGNSALSFITKLSSGYWNLFDPTNGYTAIHRSVAERIVERRIDSRYFFESDLLLHLYLLRAVVQDVPMAALYGPERSNLQISRVFLPFLFKNLRNVARRFFVHYLIRDFSLATVEALVGAVLLLFGVISGTLFWLGSFRSGMAATPGQVMIAALPILTGIQFILSSLNFDMRNMPATPRQSLWSRRRR